MGYVGYNTEKDILKERFIQGAELVGLYDFPKLDKINDFVDPELIPVVFHECVKCKKPRKAIAHFFCHDEKFERIWNNPDNYVDMLKNFKWVCSPDFTCYAGLPQAVRIYQTYKDRAIAYYLSQQGVNIIPTVGWNEPESFEWCFDGLPQHSLVAVSTNGIQGKQSEEHYRIGFSEMVRRLEPTRVVCIGHKVEVSEDIDIIYFKSFAEQMRDRINGKQRLATPHEKKKA